MIRAPFLRGRRSEYPEMDLPEGSTCGDCHWSEKCCTIYARIPEDEVCDWVPSRFVTKTGTRAVCQ